MGGASAETMLVLQDHLMQIMIADEEEGGGGKPSELDLLSSGCSGALEQIGSWGTREQVWFAVMCPPTVKKHSIGIWKSEEAFKAEAKPKEEIQLLKVLSVQPDAAEAGVFHLNYYTPDKVKTRATFRRVDRSRDVWVEVLGLLIEKIREDKESKKDDEDEKKDK